MCYLGGKCNHMRYDLQVQCHCMNSPIFRVGKCSKVFFCSSLFFNWLFWNSMVRLCVVPVQKLIIPWQETQVSNPVTTLYFACGCDECSRETSSIIYVGKA